MSTTHPTPATLPERTVRGDVYRNLNDGCLSVLDRRCGVDSYGTVIAHVQSCWIENADVVTYESKRQQAVESGQKNVHAMFRGDVNAYSEPTVADCVDPVRVEYVGDREGCFYTVDGDQVVGADDVLVDATGIRALGVTTN